MSAWRSPTWRSILALLAVLLFAGAGMAQMNELLKGMRLSGRPANTLVALGPPFRAADTERTEGVLNVWREYASEVQQPGSTLPPTADAPLAGRWFVLLDAFVFAPAYALALALFLRRGAARVPFWRGQVGTGGSTAAKRRAAGPAATEEELPLAAFAGAGIVAIGVAFLFDELENLLYWLILDRGWEGPGAVGASPLWLLAVATSSKFLFFGLALVIAAVVGWLWGAARLDAGRSSSPVPSLLGTAADRARLRLVLPQILLVLVFGLALSAHEQLPDLVRRWTVLQLVVSTVFTVAFALVAWVTTRRLLAMDQLELSAPRRHRVTQVLGLAIVGAAVLQLVLFLILRGDDYHPGWGLLVPAAFVVVLAILSRLLPRREFTREERARRQERRPVPARDVDASELALPRALASVAIVLFAFGVFQAAFGYAVFSREWHPRALIPAAAALTAALVAAFVRRGHPLLWAAPAGALATLVLAIADKQDANPSLVTVCSLLVALGGWWLYDLLSVAPEPRQELRWRDRRLSGRRAVALVIGVALGTVLLMTVAIIARPIRVGQAVGVVGVLALFVIALALLVAILVWLNGAIEPPRALRQLGLVRFPLLTFFAAWFVLAGLLDPGGYHDLRIDPSERRAAAPTLARAFDCWLAKNRLPTLGNAAGCADAANGGRARAQPLILVATTGGGIRAAYWTAVALDCAFERDLTDARDRFNPCPEEERTDDFRRSDALFALSGISGGSVGLAAYAAHLSEKDTTDVDDAWVNNRLSADALSPTGAWWLFLELPRIFLQFHVPTDRSEILEQAWEEQWPEDSFARGLFELWREEPRVPLLLLNATSVDDGCRFNVGVLDGNVATTLGTQPNCRAGTPFDEAETPQTTTTEATAATDQEALPTPGEQELLDDDSTLVGTRDLSDFLCRDRVDVPLSAAAFLSARFPFVNPSGRIEGRCVRDDRRLAYVVDGGYLDTSAGSTIAELTDELEPLIATWNADHADEGGCIVPFLVQIDNGFEDEGRARPTRRPSEVTIPLTTVFETRIGRAAQGRSAAALAYNRAFPARLDGTPLVDRYAHFVNQAHAGPRAPLGWVQSRASERELRDQILQKKNRQALHEVRRWLSGSLACDTATRP